MNHLDLVQQARFNPLASPHYHEALKKTSKAWQKAQTLPADLSPQDSQKVQTAIASVLAILQVAYPTQARNFTQGEIQTTCTLWGEIFGRVHPNLLHEAVKRFIQEDRKGFFPAPGQIVGYVEEIINQISSTEEMERNQQEIKRLLEELGKT